MVKAQPIIMMVMMFWNTMNTLLKRIFIFMRKVPRTTSIGLAREMTTAGMMPDSMPTTTTNAMAMRMLPGVNSADCSMEVLSNCAA